MNDSDIRNQIHHAMDTRLSGIVGDPWLAQRIVNERGRTKVKRGTVRKAMAIILICIMIFALSVAIAAVIISRYELKLYAGVEVIDLLPDQWQQYTICHKTKSGYIVGGFQLHDDCISPMEANDQIVYLDDRFNIRWIVRDSRLEGALFDQIKETENAFYFGLEQKKLGWHPSIMKVSKEGKIIWLYEGSEDIRLKDYIVTETDEVVCVGRIASMENKTVSPHAIIQKIDQEGQLVYENILDQQSNNMLYAVCPYQEKIVVAGVFNGEAMVGLVNDECDVVQFKTYDVDGTINALHLKQATNGHLILVINYSLVNSATQTSETSRIEYILIDIDSSKGLKIRGALSPPRGDLGSYQ